MKLLKGEFNMAIASRGKTYSDKPGWALDPKTKLELKRRKEFREAPSKHGGKVYPKDEYEYALNKDKYDADVSKAVDKEEISKVEANKIAKIQEMMRKEKAEKEEQEEKEARKKKKSREVVTSENREAYMAKKLKLASKQEPVYKEE
jgi:hypothetical protein